MPLQRLEGPVAVVTGGASGIGRAMGERFARAGMRVVLADVESPALDATVTELRQRDLDVHGVVTDVSRYDSVEALRDAVYDRHGAVHLLCNNAGVGGGADGRLWEHDLDDWRWALDVNLWGVIHGVKAFVPSMLAGGEEGHVVNTSSGNGGIAPMPGTPIYALTKAGVVSVSECLYAQLRQAGAAIGASVLFPGPNVVRTNLFTSWRNRPAELAGRPRRAPTTIESFEQRLAAAGVELVYTEPEDVAEQVVDAVRDGRFWILAPSERADGQIRARAESMLARTDPTYLRDLTG